MTNEITNVSSKVEVQNNIWTLSKHVASSVNKAAAKVDARVYGPIVKQGTVQLPPQQRLPPEKDNFFTIVGYIVVGLIVATAAVVIFIGYCRGDIKGRHLLGF